MARPLVLLICLALAAATAATAAGRNSQASIQLHPDFDDDLGIFTEDQLLASVSINQLAILKMMSLIKRECESESESEVKREVHQLKEELASLQSIIAFQGHSFHYEGKVYHVHTENNMTWVDARVWCQQRGGDLAQPTGNMNNFMEEVTKRIPVREYQRVWLGATDLNENGSWQWHSGRVLHPSTPWSRGNPSGNGEHCIELYTESKQTPTINDNTCEKQQYFVCEQ